MRKIKFRAWEKNLKEMIPVEDISFERTGMINTNSAWRFFDEIELMQFTGLVDKNGMEIYEGDILLIDDETTLVTFDDGCFCALGYLGDGRTYPIRSSMFTGKKLEVIGNEYEHSELMKWG